MLHFDSSFKYSGNGNISRVTTYFDTLLEEHRNESKLSQVQINKLASQVETLDERFALGIITPEIYDKVKGKYQTELDEIRSKTSNNVTESSNLQNCINHALKICLNPSELWASRDVESKIRLQKVLFPDGITLKKGKRRVLTFRMNSIFAPIAAIAKELKKVKSGQSICLDQFSARVTPAGQSSNFLEDFLTLNATEPPLSNNNF